MLPVKPKKDLERIRQLIFNAKTEHERKMWQRVLNKLEGRK